MTDTATIEALEAAIARAEDECPNAPYVPVKIELAKQSASTIRALSAENERLRAVMDLSQTALDRSRCVIKFHVKDPGSCCFMGEDHFSALDAYKGNIEAYNTICELKEANTTRAIEKES